MKMQFIALSVLFFPHSPLFAQDILNFTIQQLGYFDGPYIREDGATRSSPWLLSENGVVAGRSFKYMPGDTRLGVGWTSESGGQSSTIGLAVQYVGTASRVTDYGSWITRDGYVGSARSHYLGH